VIGVQGPAVGSSPAFPCMQRKAGSTLLHGIPGMLQLSPQSLHPVGQRCTHTPESPGDMVKPATHGS